MDPITIALIGSIVVSLISTAISSASTDKQLQAQKELQEDAQDFNHTERVEQNGYQQQMHEFNLVNDPKLMMQGFHAIGMSDAAAIQAIAGSPSTGFSPTASNVGSGIGTAPNMQGPAQMFQGINDALNSYFENQLKEKQGKKTDVEAVYTKQLYNESVKNIEFRAKELDLHAEEIQIAKDLAASQIGLNQSEVDLNYGKLDEVNAKILEIGAHIENMDAETVKAYAEASLYRQKTAESVAQTEYIQTSTAEVQAQTELLGKQQELVGEQIKGQQIANLDANTVLAMKEYRLEVSKALGVDVDAPLVTQTIEAMLSGRYDTLAKLLEAKESDGTNIIGTYNRTKTMKKSGYNSTKKSIGIIEEHPFSPSFQSSWNPN